MEGPEILKSEVRLVLDKMNWNKTEGENGIVIKMLTVLDDFSIDKNAEMISKIYNSGKILEDLSKPTLVALPKEF